MKKATLMATVLMLVSGYCMAQGAGLRGPGKTFWTASRTATFISWTFFKTANSSTRITVFQAPSGELWPAAAIQHFLLEKGGEESKHC